MKKIISLVTASLLAFAIHIPVTVFAHPVMEIPSSFDFEMEMRLGLDVQTPEMDAALGILLAFLRNVNINTQGTVIMDMDTSNIFHAHIETEIYAGFFYIPISLWVDIDISNPENIVYIMLVEMPEIIRSLAAIEDPDLARPYWVFDFGTIISDAYVQLEGIDPNDFFLNYYFNFGDFFLDGEELLALLPEVEALGGNLYRWAITDEWIAEVISTFIVDHLWEMYVGQFNFDEDFFIGYEAELAEFIEQLSEIFDHVTIFSEDWASYYLLDDYGYPVRIDSSFQMVFNLLEWMSAIALVHDDVLLEDFPDIVITFDMEYSISYTNVNRANPVPLPELTAENSVNILDLILRNHSIPVTFPMLAMN